jgi:urease gamma subunit
LIHVKAIITGEPDTQSTIKLFQYDTDSENIFQGSIDEIKNRLSKNLRINLNETILVYCAYVVSCIREGKSSEEIIQNASKILSQDNVMIGVPESIRKISFEALVDNKQINISFTEPLQVSDYILIPKNL